jgi:hypothetical protein
MEGHKSLRYVLIMGVILKGAHLYNKYGTEQDKLQITGASEGCPIIQHALLNSSLYICQNNFNKCN